MNSGIFESIPIWALYILTFLLALLFFEVGYRYGVNRYKNVPADSDKSLDAMTGATLGLLAFLLAFVMSIAIDRYDRRRELVVEEATTIHKAYLQAGYLNEPYSDNFRSLLTEYIGLRISTGNNVNITEHIQKSEAIQAEIWAMADQMVKEDPGRDEVALFLESLSDLVGLHTQRVTAAFSSRLPPVIILGMYFVAMLTMMMVGLENSTSDNRNLFTSLSLILIFTIVFMLIIDLDRPQDGFLRVSQQALIDVQSRMNRFIP